MTQLIPKDLAPGAYWYIVSGKPASICEKREGEDYVRFTNGSYQRWVKPGERFDGPIQPSTGDTDVNRAALLVMLNAFDNSENRSAERNANTSAALKQGYQALGMPWPEVDSEPEDIGHIPSMSDFRCTTD